MSTVKMKCWRQFVTFLIGLSEVFVNSQLAPFSCSDVVYIGPNSTPASWSEAQNSCRMFNATLPIVDTPDHQKCFDLALKNFNINNAFVWMGANSSGGNTGEWRWLNGSTYNGSKISRGSDYQQSYAYMVKNGTSGFMFSAPWPKTTYPFICQYPVSDNVHCKNQTNQTAIVRNGVCYVMYNQTVSWFNARYSCLLNGGDLAIFPDLSVLNEMNDTFNGSYWIGLRSIWWKWIDIVTGVSMDVTYTLWNDGQPDGQPDSSYSQCLSTDTTNFPNWRDYKCSEPEIFICQISKPLTPSSTEASGKTTFQPSEPNTFPTNHHETKGNETSQENIGKSNGVDKVALGVGIGVGVGVPLIIAAVVVIALICRRHRKRFSKSGSGSKEPRSSPDSTNPQPSFTIYAEIPKGPEDHSSTHGYGDTTQATPTVYAPLQIVDRKSTQDFNDSNQMHRVPEISSVENDSAQYGAVRKDISKI